MAAPLSRRRSGRSSRRRRRFRRATAAEYGKVLGKILAGCTLFALLGLLVTVFSVGITLGRDATPVVLATPTVTPTPVPTATATPAPTAPPISTTTLGVRRRAATATVAPTVPIPALPSTGGGGMAPGSGLGITRRGIE